MLTLLLAAVMGFNGWILSKKLVSVDLDLDPGEQTMVSILLGFACWVGGNWILAITGLLGWEGLLLLALIGLTTMVGQRKTLLAAFHELRSPGVHVVRQPGMLFLAPVALWIVYGLWAGTMLPVDNHDALAYHFPKAVLVMKAHTVSCFPSPDPRIAYFPWNYELLLSDFLILGKSDQFSLWLSTAFFVAFLHAAWVTSKRWTGDVLAGVACLLAISTAPVLLMHSVAYKNDLMFGLFGFYTIYWFAKWWNRRKAFELLLCGIAGCVASGTKPTGLLLMGIILPSMVWRRLRTPSRSLSIRKIAGVLAFGAVLFVLLGGWGYILNLYSTGHINGPNLMPAPNGAMSVEFPELHYSWMFPILLLLVPFSGRPDAVWVPWRHEWWFWPRNEIYFSHFGALFSILFLAIPFVWWIVRKRHPDGERDVVVVLSLLLGALISCIGIKPYGGFAWSPRLLFYLTPACAVLTAGYGVRWAGKLNWRLPLFIVLLLCGDTVMTMFSVMKNDAFSPFSYIWKVATSDKPVPLQFSSYRAPEVLSMIDGGKGSVALFGDFESWIYPLYGEGADRSVVFIDPGRLGEPMHGIPQGTEWVVVDRSFEAIWGHPEFKTMGDFEKCLAKWHPSNLDLALIQSLLKDPRYEPIYIFGNRGQAVFHLRTDGPASLGPLRKGE